MAVAGSAVGLGNFLRFPGLAAQYGGGAFMLAYAISFLIIGLPIGWAEWAMGRHAGGRGYNSCPGAFAAIVRRPWAKYAGIIGVIVPVVIYMYYVVIEAWCLGYAVNFWTGKLDLKDAGETVDLFAKFTGAKADGSAMSFESGKVLPWLLGVFFFNFFLIYRGISGGIEKMCKIGMPLLIVLALVLLVRVLTLGAPDESRPHDSVGNGLGYLWNPTKVMVVKTAPGPDDKPLEVVGAAAIEQAKAEVAASNGALVLPRDRRGPAIAQSTPLARGRRADLFQSVGRLRRHHRLCQLHAQNGRCGAQRPDRQQRQRILRGGARRPHHRTGGGGLPRRGGRGRAGGVGLGFKVLPLVFAKMPAGDFFGGAFFFMLFLAAVTSSISMLQPGIAFVEEALGVGRKVSVTLLGLLTCFGAGFVIHFSGDLKALDTLDFWVGTFLIFLLATVQIIIFGWVWGIDRGFDELHQGAAIRVPWIFRPIIKWICPAFLLIVFTLWFMQEILGMDLSSGAGAGVSYYVTDLFGEKASLPAQLSAGLVVVIAIFFALMTSRAAAYRRAEQGLTKDEL